MNSVRIHELNSLLTNFSVQIHKLFRLFSLSQNSKTKLYKLLSFNSPDMIHVNCSLHSSDAKVLLFPFQEQNLFQPNFKVFMACYSQFDKSQNSQNLITPVFIFRSLSRPWKWQLIFRKYLKASKTYRNPGVIILITLLQSILFRRSS